MNKADKSEIGRLLNSFRTNTRNAGRKKILRPCPKCGLVLSAREMHKHTRCGGREALPPYIEAEPVDVR